MARFMDSEGTTVFRKGTTPGLKSNFNASHVIRGYKDTAGHMENNMFSFILSLSMLPKKNFTKILDSKTSKAKNIPTRILTFKQGSRKIALYVQDHLACNLTKTWKIVY